LPCYVCTCVIVHSLVSLILRHPRLSLFPYTTLFRSRAASVRSIAVCYLFSYANPSHEERTRAIIRDVFPEAHVSLSSEVLPRIREWPRLSTTLLNAYLGPVLVDYIGHLNAGLDEGGVTTQQRFLMQSNGGVMPFAAALQGSKTVYTLFSG